MEGDFNVAKSPVSVVTKCLTSCRSLVLISRFSTWPDGKVLSSQLIEHCGMASVVRLHVDSIQHRTVKLTWELHKGNHIFYFWT
jgi:hypothetical protein